MLNHVQNTYMSSNKLYIDVGENRYIPVYAGCSSSILPVELHPTETPPATALVLTCRNDGGEGYIRGNNLSTDPDDIRLMKDFEPCIYNGDANDESEQQEHLLTPKEIRQCRDCLAKKIISKNMFDRNNNNDCTEYNENSVCEIYTESCSEYCGPCTQTGYNLLPCINNNKYDTCPINCFPQLEDDDDDDEITPTKSPSTAITMAPSEEQHKTTTTPSSSSTSCLPRNSICTSFKDCCSKRCGFGKCLPAIRIRKTSLAMQRVGAAGNVKGNRSSGASSSTGSNRIRQRHLQQKIRGN